MSAPTPKRTGRRHAPRNPEAVRSNIQLHLYNLAKKYDLTNDEVIQSTRMCGGKVIIYFKKGGIPKYKVIPPRPAIMHPYRAETMNAVKLALLLLANFNSDASLLFEVSHSMETIARMVGQCHTYDNGRVSFDCVRNAIFDFELAEYLYVAREICKETGINKANRIFLTPAFFASFGVTERELHTLMQRLRNYRKHKGTLASINAREKAEFERRNEHARIAGIWRSDIHAKLKAIKERFVQLARQIKEAAKAKQAAKAARKAEKQARKAQAKQEHSANKTLAAIHQRAAAAAPAETANSYLQSIAALFDDPLPT